MFDSLLSTFVATMFAMQAASAPAPSSATSKETKATVTLTGCVRPNMAAPGTFTFAETGRARNIGWAPARGSTSGQHVEIVGAPVGRRLTIRGGLYPSPNVAAQAGALDPAQAAIASLPGATNSGTGTVELPEFRMTRVRALAGSCQMVDLGSWRSRIPMWILPESVLTTMISETRPHGLSH